MLISIGMYGTGWLITLSIIEIEHDAVYSLSLIDVIRIFHYGRNFRSNPFTGRPDWLARVPRGHGTV
jgi:hypothetical protein